MAADRFDHLFIAPGSYDASLRFYRETLGWRVVDEWGGGGAPKCRATDKPERGADALFTIENGNLVFKSYYKMLAPQTKFENCVAHNGSMIPIPGTSTMRLQLAPPSLLRKISSKGWLRFQVVTTTVAGWDASTQTAA